jgi:hypothetical protein
MKECKVILVETVEHELTFMVEDESESDIEEKVIEMLSDNQVDLTKGKTVNVRMYIEK